MLFGSPTLVFLKLFQISWWLENVVMRCNGGSGAVYIVFVEEIAAFSGSGNTGSNCNSGNNGECVGASVQCLRSVFS